MPGYRREGLTPEMQRAIDETPADERSYLPSRCPSCGSPLQFPTDGDGHTFEQCSNGHCDNRFAKPFDRLALAHEGVPQRVKKHKRSRPPKADRGTLPSPSEIGMPALLAVCRARVQDLEAQFRSLEAQFRSLDEEDQ